MIIKAEGELAAAKNMSAAAKLLESAPGALHLRTLQSINDLSSDQSNTTIWMLPVEALRALEGLGKHFGNNFFGNDEISISRREKKHLSPSFKK